MEMYKEKGESQESARAHFTFLAGLNAFNDLFRRICIKDHLRGEADT